MFECLVYREWGYETGINGCGLGAGVALLEYMCHRGEGVGGGGWGVGFEVSNGQVRLSANTGVEYSALQHLVYLGAAMKAMD